MSAYAGRGSLAFGIPKYHSRKFKLHIVHLACRRGCLGRMVNSLAFPLLMQRAIRSRLSQRFEPVRSMAWIFSHSFFQFVLDGAEAELPLTFTIAIAPVSALDGTSYARQRRPSLPYGEPAPKRSTSDSALSSAPQRFDIMLLSLSILTRCQSAESTNSSR